MTGNALAVRIGIAYTRGMSPIRTAIDAVGSQSALAALLGVRQPTVSEWLRGERPVPIERCVDIERVTDGAVTRRDLRPDDWHRIWPELDQAERRVA